MFEYFQTNPVDVLLSVKDLPFLQKYLVHIFKYIYFRNHYLICYATNKEIFAS